VSAERNTHLLDWLSDGHTHCQHGTKEWCEAYLHNARDVISAQDAALASTQEEIARLTLALEPLAAIAAAVFYIDEDGREMNSHRPDDLAVWGFDRVELTYGHLRAARSLLPSKPVAANPLPGEQGPVDIGGNP
jgi:hypothetical protein